MLMSTWCGSFLHYVGSKGHAHAGAERLQWPREDHGKSACFSLTLEPLAIEPTGMRLGTLLVGRELVKATAAGAHIRQDDVLLGFNNEDAAHLVSETQAPKELLSSKIGLRRASRQRMVSVVGRRLLSEARSSWGQQPWESGPFPLSLSDSGSAPGNRGQAAWATSRSQRGRRPRRVTGGGGTVEVSSSWSDQR